MRKFVCLGLAAAMAASLTACGGSSSSGTATTAAATQASSGTGTETAAGDAEGSAAAEGGVIKLGVMGPLTGPAAAYGVAVVNGADLAVKEINAAGGINGIQIELNAQDDEHDPEKAVNAYNTLKDWGMQMLVGATTSKPCIAVAAESEADNLFQITPSGSGYRIGPVYR